MSTKVVVLTGRSLFTEGVISKLRRSTQMRSFDIVDLCQPNPLQAIEELRPDVLVVDGNDPEYIAKLRGNNFSNLSHLKIIFLDSQSARTRVLQWEEHDATQISDLLDELNVPETVKKARASAIGADAEPKKFGPNLVV